MNNWIFVLAVVGLVWLPRPVAALTAGPDDFGYLLADEQEVSVNYNWVNMSTGTQLFLSDDDTSDPIQLGFSFVFYGQSYTQVHVTSNGMLWFEFQDVPLFNGTRCPLPQPAQADSQVAFYQRDFNPASPSCTAGCSVVYATGGAEPNRWFGVTYHQVPVFGEGGDPPDPVTVQVLLYEGTNEILVQVQDSGLHQGGDATIGIEAPGGISGLNLPGCLADGSVGDEKAILFTPPTGGYPVVPLQQTGWNLPGEQLDYEFTVFNLEADEASFDLSVSGYSWPTSLSNSSLTVAPGAQESFQVQVSVPAGTAGGLLDTADVTLTPLDGDPLSVSTTTFAQDLPDEWQILPPMPVAVLQPAVGVEGGDLWLAGGNLFDPLSGAMFNSDALQVLRTGNMSWEHSDANQGGTLEPLPEPLSRAAGCVLDGKFYLTGGLLVTDFGQEVSDGLLIYDIAGNSWSAGTSMPQGRNYHAAVCDPERGTLFVVGGLGPEVGGEMPITTSLWAYDVAGNSWDQSLDSMEVALYLHAAQFLSPDTVLVAGGSTDLGVSADSLSYDIPSNTWQRVGDLPAPRVLHASGVLDDGRMCVMGGTTLGPAAESATDSTVCHSQGFWIPQLAVMNVGRAFCAGASVAGHLVAVGGSSTLEPALSGIFDSLERYPSSPYVEPDGGPDAGDAGVDAGDPDDPDAGTDAGDTDDPDAGIDAGVDASDAGPDGGPLVCEPGATQLCHCTADQQGVQVCTNDGSGWGDCQCEEESGSDDGCGCATRTSGSGLLPWLLALLMFRLRRVASGTV